MISPGLLRKGLANVRRRKPSSDGFLYLHRHVEGYTRRVLFIGLRLHDVRYATAEMLIDQGKLSFYDSVRVALNLVLRRDQSIKDISKELVQTHPRFVAFFGLVLEFTTKYRNALAHGLVQKVKDPEILGLLFRIDLEFLQCFEALLHAEKGRSAYDKPRDWGALRGKEENIATVVQRLRLRGLSDRPLRIEEVRARIAAIESNSRLTSVAIGN